MTELCERMNNYIWPSNMHESHGTLGTKRSQPKMLVTQGAWGTRGRAVEAF